MTAKVKLNKVAIVGGTHGNELTGAYLVKKFERNPSLIKRSSFQSLTLLANPRAFKVNLRYVDKDLNRCFAHQDLANLNLTSYEDLRAKEIKQILSPKLDSSVDLIIDCHSTTANLGITLILGSENPFLLSLAAFITALNPAIKIYRWNNYHNRKDNPFLRSLAPLGLTLEVGAIAHGVIDPWLFKQTEATIYAILDYLEAYKLNQLVASPTKLTLYQNIETVDFPRNQQGDILAMIHPNLMAQDYNPLQPGDLMFQTFEGNNILYQGKTTVYPVFIAESSYLEKGIAMCLTHKREIML